MEENFFSQKNVIKISLLGQVLIKKGMINSGQLEEALYIQKNNKKGLLGEILIQLGYITQELLAVALAGQSEFVYIPVEKYKFSKEVIKSIPMELAYKYFCIPLEKMNEVMTVAMADPMNRAAVEEIQRTAQCKIICMVGAQDQIEMALIAHYKT